MNPLLISISREKILVETAEKIRRGLSSILEISSESLLPLISGFLSSFLQIPIIVVMEKEEGIAKLANDIKSLFDINATYIFYDPTDKENSWRRTSLVAGFIRGEFPIIVTTPESITNFPAVGMSLVITRDIKWDYLISTLSEFGYKRVFMVEKKGEFSIRGGIIDIFPINLPYPIRLDFFGDELTYGRKFNITTQRSSGDINFPISVFPSDVSLVSSDIKRVVSPDTLFIITSNKFIPQGRILKIEEGKDIIGEYPPLIYGDMTILKGKIDLWIRQGFEIYLYTLQSKRLQEIIRRHRDIKFYKKKLSTGVFFPSQRIVILSDRELFNYEYAPTYPLYPKVQVEIPFDIGDYVVHPYHGIGRFVGLETHTVEMAPREFLVLEFAEEDRLLVPVEQVGRLDKYRSFNNEPPALHRLKSPEWSRIRAKVEKDVKTIAKDLIEINAKREVSPGISFKGDLELEKALEEGFPYEETPNQIEIIERIKKSMERPRPMDFLVCGDPGYGKTEIALRVAFRAVLNGKQVALLVPTTILAHQHYETFRERLAPFPVKIAMLSRFVSQKETREIKSNLAKGDIDIVIGTHKILSKDISFKDLGLLIIDEEHRFGVIHKERLKELFPLVDVLTLTATPIPRTLSMSLYGLKEVGIIETPPEGRLPIYTYVGEYDEKIVKEAVKRELSRNGQVFYVHPRIEGVKELEFRLKGLFPDLTIDILYGTMDEDEVEEKFWRFYKGEIKLLISTAIIESGIDIPNANTLIIEEGEKFGLAQLYQLRGRIGRSGKRGYAYIFHSKNLTSDGEGRLRTIYENTALGSGFNISMRDLEIRGLGNLLGKEQHGHIIAVGFDLYTKMLEDAVRELKGEPLQWRTEPTVIEVNIPALIPDSYIPSPYKLEIYRRLSLVSSVDEIEDLKNELRDRFGDIPKEVNNLLKIATLRVLAQRRMIRKISITDDRILLFFRDKEDNKLLERLKRFGEIRRLNAESWVLKWWEDRLEKLAKLKEAFIVA